MKYIKLLTVFIVISLLQNSPVSGGAIEKFQSIIESCKKDKKQHANCERQMWKFTDVTGDQKLSKAEIVRVIRILSKHQSLINNATSEESDHGGVFLIILGPILGDYLLSNFDFNGDGFVTKQELYQDSKEGEIIVEYNELFQQGEKATADAMMLALGGFGKTKPKNDKSTISNDNSPSTDLDKLAKLLEGAKKRAGDGSKKGKSRPKPTKIDHSESLLVPKLENKTFKRADPQKGSFEDFIPHYPDKSDISCGDNMVLL